MSPLQIPQSLTIELPWLKIVASGSLALGALVVLVLIMLGARFLFRGGR